MRGSSTGSDWTPDPSVPWLTSDLLPLKARKPRSRLAEELSEPWDSRRKAEWVMAPSSGGKDAAVSSEARPISGLEPPGPWLGIPTCAGRGWAGSEGVSGTGVWVFTDLDGPGQVGRGEEDERGAPKAALTAPSSCSWAASPCPHPCGRTCAAGGHPAHPQMAAAPTPPRPAATIFQASASVSVGSTRGNAGKVQADPHPWAAPASRGPPSRTGRQHLPCSVGAADG